MLAKGIDPLDAKKADQEAAAARKTFGQCADELIKSKRREWRSEVHAAQWRTTIDDYCGPILDKPVDAIDTASRAWRSCNRFGSGFQKPRRASAAGSRRCLITQKHIRPSVGRKSGGMARSFGADPAEAAKAFPRPSRGHALR